MTRCHQLNCTRNVHMWKRIKTSKKFLEELKEDEEQKLLVDYLNINGILFYHVPNGGYRTILEAVKLKRQGVKKGVPDICICSARKGHHGLYIELKRKNLGSVSISQAEWIKNLNSAGYLAFVAYGFDEAKKIVDEYFG